MGITPSQPVSIAAEEGVTASPAAPSREVLDELFELAGASAYGLPPAIFESILVELGEEQALGLQIGSDPPGTATTADERVAWLRGLRLNEIVLARACARGNEEAWRYFLTQYRQPVLRAAIAITRSESLGTDLAENLYAELYGLNLRDGQRRSPLASYRGRGSLIGWLRTILAQRHIDHYRRTGREQSLEDEDSHGELSRFDPPAPEPTAMPNNAAINNLSTAIQLTLEQCDAEDRFLLASYYLDRRTLLEIAKMLRVHEATISRRVHRTTERLHKELLHRLRAQGLSKRAAEEMLGTDPRDVEINLRRLLQSSASQPFSEEEGQ